MAELAELEHQHELRSLLQARIAGEKNLREKIKDPILPSRILGSENSPGLREVDTPGVAIACAERCGNVQAEPSYVAVRGGTRLSSLVHNNAFGARERWIFHTPCLTRDTLSL